MHNNIKISIIVPFYNVELYIVQCLDSILRHKRKDIEVLLIDDCGADSSRSIAERYAKVDNRVKILTHSVNKGPGGARNTGVGQAKGEYIWFVDSDDTIEYGSLDKLCEWIESVKVDAFLFDRYTYSQDELFAPFVHRYVPSGVSLQCTKQHGLDIFDTSYQMCWLSEQLIRTNPIATAFVFCKKFLQNNGLVFAQNLYFEDVIVPLWASVARSIAYCVGSVFYNYRQQASSITNAKSRLKATDRDKVSMMMHIVNFATDKDNFVQQLALTKIIDLTFFREYYFKENIIRTVKILIYAKNTLAPAFETVYSICLFNKLSQQQAKQFADQLVSANPDKKLLFKIIKNRIDVNVRKRILKKYLPSFIIRIVQRYLRKKRTKKIKANDKIG